LKSIFWYVIYTLSMPRRQSQNTLYPILKTEILAKLIIDNSSFKTNWLTHETDVMLSRSDCEFLYFTAKTHDRSLKYLFYRFLFCIYLFKCFSVETFWYSYSNLCNLKNFPISWIAKIATFLYLIDFCMLWRSLTKGWQKKEI
jgi:hypothetical protein